MSVLTSHALCSLRLMRDIYSTERLSSIKPQTSSQFMTAKSHAMLLCPFHGLICSMSCRRWSSFAVSGQIKLYQLWLNLWCPNWGRNLSSRLLLTWVRVTWTPTPPFHLFLCCLPEPILWTVSQFSISHRMSRFNLIPALNIVKNIVTLILRRFTKVCQWQWHGRCQIPGHLAGSGPGPHCCQNDLHSNAGRDLGVFAELSPGSFLDVYPGENMWGIHSDHMPPRLPTVANELPLSQGKA